MTRLIASLFLAGSLAGTVTDSFSANLSDTTVSNPSPATDIRQQIDRYVKSEMQERRIPGMQLAVVKGGKIVLLQSYGLAEIPNAVAVNDQNVFSINSATKSFTGVAIMQLVEDGKLDLSAPVSRYLDGLPVAWQTVTVRQLLTHTSGIPDIISSKIPSLATPQEVDAAWAAIQTWPMEFKTGERYRYNQTNYILLGKMIDRLSGMPFIDFFQQRQFAVAGMRSVGFGDSRDVIPRKAVSYRYEGQSTNLKHVVEVFPPFLRTGAGMNSSAEDIANWLIALQQGKLISAAGLKQLWTPGTFNNGKPTVWALGWPVVRQGDYAAVAGMGGARSAFYVYPDHDLAIVTLTNLAGAEPQAMIDDIAGFYLPGLRKAHGGTYAVHLLREQIAQSGYDGLTDKLKKIKTDQGLPDPSEDEFNSWGYRLLGKKLADQAVAVFGLGIQVYPNSANLHDSLAEVYEFKADTASAVKHYRLSLALDSQNRHASERLQALSAR
ncbi:beta-lactamase family protein [Undibacterium sp. CY18W]|uniref:Beta-lactamase family protein n=1 Tax=Undibacterium hunanense TaxID=2762292 RepID=A0ABR6ZXJ2_9BURK|nr:serine hydrolase domain-containing protein [Undibacterium hunanense]MBC3920499.1 beta-lactamase family protein [Undibacterium hunanense]